MPYFSANISMLFTEHELPDRMKAAADAGFAAVEIQFPYDHSADALAKSREAAGVEIVLINFPAGDLDAGDRGIACLPDREVEFRKGVAIAGEYAEALGCKTINTLAGCPPEGGDRRDAFLSLSNSIAYAAKEMVRHGIRVVVEAVNDITVPGFLLNRIEDAAAVIEHAGHPNLAIQADIFHMAMMRENIAPELAKHVDRIGHMQFADAPGRHEPGTGELDFDALFQAIDGMGYAGWIGAEYNPTGSTEDSLAWMRKLPLTASLGSAH